MVKVTFTGDFCDDYTGGVREFDFEAPSLRDVVRTLDGRYPGLGEHLENEATLAVDGEIQDLAYHQQLCAGCEIYFIPKIEGG